MQVFQNKFIKLAVGRLQFPWLVLALAAVPAFSQQLYMSDRSASRVLDQATWGPTANSIPQLAYMGMVQWLTWQFAANTSDLPDQPLLNATGGTNTDIRPVQAAFFENAVSGEDQLRQRVAFALSEIWVVSHDTVTPAYAFPPYWRIFRDNAFGNYRDIIRAVTLSPAMGRYLNMANNNKANTAKGIAANENYARELMQLFTLGLNQLNMDGTPVLDASGLPVLTYDQSAVTNLAKAFTGWTYPTAPGVAAKANNPAYYVGPMFAVNTNHDASAKTIFGGVQIPANQSAEQDLESVINALMAQRTMAPFISKQLIQHLVTSNPSPAYIARVAGAFWDDGFGIRGDMRAVITAVIMDPEARQDDYPVYAVAAPNFGHLREPVLFIASMLRGLFGSAGDASTLYNNTASLGQDLFNAPSVFSYFSPQFRTQTGLLGPEFQIYSTQTAATRAGIISSAIFGTLDKTTKVDLTQYVAADTSLDRFLDATSYVFLHHSMSPALYQAAHDAAAANKAPADQVKAALYIVLTSNEYQVIH